MLEWALLIGAILLVLGLLMGVKIMPAVGGKALTGLLIVIGLVLAVYGLM